MLSSLAICAAQAKRQDSANALYDRLFAIPIPDDGDERTVYLRALNNACVQAHAAGDYATAVRIADRAQPVVHENLQDHHAAAQPARRRATSRRRCNRSASPSSTATCTSRSSRSTAISARSSTGPEFKACSATGARTRRELVPTRVSGLEAKQGETAFAFLALRMIAPVQRAQLVQVMSTWRLRRPTPIRSCRAASRSSTSR